MAKPKPRIGAPKKPHVRPHAEKVRAAAQDAVRKSTVDLPTDRADRASATLRESIARDTALADLHPAQAAYLYAVNQVSILAEILVPLPPLHRFADLLERAEEEYTPGWPPLSPISRSHFTAWAFFDAAVGIDRETIGTLILDLAPTLALQPELVSLVAHLQASRLGLHVHEGTRDDQVLLRELHTGIRRSTVPSNLYFGRPGELWLTRVLPPPDASSEVHVALTSPYVIQSPGEAEWLSFFQRTLPKLRARDEGEAFERLMKYGLGPNYWNEYVVEGYLRATDQAIWLLGLPDVAESRPQSSTYDRAFRFEGG
ncbi:MAG: hypothetical protein ABJE95_23415 [Byssovorax sp.]